MINKNKKTFDKQDDPIYQKACDIAAQSIDFNRFIDEDDAIERYRELRRDIYDDMMFKSRYYKY